MALLFATAGLFFACGAASACDIPVFRYALEHWVPETYEAYFVSDKSGSAEAKECYAKVNAAGANVKLASAEEVAGKMPAYLEKRVSGRMGRDGGGDAVVLRSQKDGQDATYWLPVQGVADLETLADSPARKKIAAKLLAGDSAVFVLLERGNAAKLMECTKRLNEFLSSAEKRIALSQPKQEEKISKKIPLRLKFSTVVLAAADPKERLFVEHLLQMKTNAGIGPSYESPSGEQPDRDAPLVVAFIGRGRGVKMFSGAFTEKEILELCEYLCGPCSCTVKRGNPGVDFIFAVDWEKEVEPAALSEGSKDEKGVLKIKK